MPDGGAATAGKGHNRKVEISAEDFLAAVAHLGDLKEKKDAAAKAFQKARKEARAAGVRLTALDEALKAREMERGDRTEHYDHVSRYMEWLKVPKGFQFTLFKDEAGDAFSDDDSGAEKDLLSDAECKGFNAGLANQPTSDNPYEANSAAGQAWLKQHGLGTKARKTGKIGGDA